MPLAPFLWGPPRFFWRDKRNGVEEEAPEGGIYAHDHLTDFLDVINGRAKFHYWLFGHYHDNKIIDDRYVLLWEQIVQVV